MFIYISAYMVYAGQLIIVLYYIACIQLITEDYCFQPQHRVLSSIKLEFGTKWKYVGYNLELDHNVIDHIKLNFQTVEDQSFQILVEWIQRDVKSCYCKLISAMTEEGLHKGVEKLKCKIKSSKILLVFKKQQLTSYSADQF